ncbi:tRNA glutamyl-Q(34) synthetase GluQRS [Salinispirillum marinum]|uniref:Glutamyl-Q tRNA(Asp) synthetase n=2 Tax=Saccharospirillaceae TaxID=255527 RepID=A0ABV8BHT9_9GAMM
MANPPARPVYIGRFAPSPSGPLHFGSLVTALGSYLDARAHNGQWYVRMEDIDPPREQPGAADDILRTLEAFGLHWDGPVVWQSSRSEAYLAALEALAEHCFYCTCTRAELRPYEGVYPGTCRARQQRLSEQHSAIRLRTPDTPLCFHDRVQGQICHTPQETGGDPILRRKDGLWAYQLAVVVDDGAQGITDVVRGNDLLNTTAGQVYLQQCLGLPTPRYLHLPLMVDAEGRKLSKQNHAPALDPSAAKPLMLQALNVLGIAPPAHLNDATLEEILRWGIAHWLDHVPSLQPTTVCSIALTETLTP